METITVYKETKTTNKIEIEIEDINNCYLKGRDSLLNVERYLGIWENDIGLRTVDIIDNSGICLDFSEKHPVDARGAIEYFLKDKNNVEIISEQEFRDKLTKIMSLLKK